jgi:hypothetical protein
MFNVQMKSGPGFNNQGQILLSDYDAQLAPEISGAPHLDYVFVDLNQVDTSHPDFAQDGIRQEVGDGGDNERVQSFKVSFAHSGWLTSFPPPCIDTEGNWLDGRGRVRAAKENGERWIPVARYARTDKSIRNTVSNGVSLNGSAKPVYRTTFAEFVNAGVHLINMGELANTQEAVESWLYKEACVENVYDNLNGTITRMRDTIIRNAAIDDSLLRTFNNGSATRWVEKNQGLSRGEYVLVNSSDVSSCQTYAERAFCRHILPAIVEGLEDSMTIIQKLYNSMFEVVNRLYSGTFAVATLPADRAYVVMGAIPQIVKDHNVDGTKLVDVNEY